MIQCPVSLLPTVISLFNPFFILFFTVCDNLRQLFAHNEIILFSNLTHCFLVIRFIKCDMTCTLHDVFFIETNRHQELLKQPKVLMITHLNVGCLDDNIFIIKKFRKDTFVVIRLNTFTKVFKFDVAFNCHWSSPQVQTSRHHSTDARFWQAPPHKIRICPHRVEYQKASPYQMLPEYRDSLGIHPNQLTVEAVPSSC